MGLDIYNRDGDSILEDFEDKLGYYLKEGFDPEPFTNLLVAYQDGGDGTELDTIIQIIKDLPEDQKETGAVDRITQIINSARAMESYQVSEENAALAERHQWIHDEEDVTDSRMGSYGMLHIGRNFAHLVGLQYQQWGEDVMTSTRKLTMEELDELIIHSADGSRTDYCLSPVVMFDALNNHSDCDGTYLPTEERISAEVGSSVQLLKELDRLYETGLFDLLHQKKQDIEKIFPAIEYASEETKIIYHTAGNVFWVLSKMLWHAVTSVEDGEEICFG